MNASGDGGVRVDPRPIAIVVIVILQVVGQQVNNVFSNVSNGLAA
jgi:hypothetical protein